MQVSLQKWLSDKGNRVRSSSREHVRIALSFAQRRAPGLGCMLSRNLKPRKLILRAFSGFPRNLAPPKITRHTVAIYIKSAIMQVPAN